MMYRDNLENQINKPRLLKKWRNLDTKLSRSRDGRDVTNWWHVPPPVPDALRGVHWKHCGGLWPRRWREKKVADFTTVCPRASGRPDAMFSPKRNEQRNQTWSSVFGNAHVSNLSETLLEDNKDHLLNRARTDLARREIHVESLNKCLNVVQKERRHKTGHFTTYKTNLSNFVENKLDCNKNCCGKRKLFEIRRFEVCTKWEEWRDRKNSNLKNSRCKKNWGKTMRLIQQLTSQLQQMQGQMNTMNDAGDLQDAEKS